MDHSRDAFFMRTEVAGELNATALLSELQKDLPPNSEIRILPQGRQRLVLLATKEPHCLGDLLLRHAAGGTQCYRPGRHQPVRRST